MSSSRRVKKGPGRRPPSAKRQRFMELRARGWSISAAGREVGVSRTAANNWARGYKTYRRGEAVGFVPALDRLAVRQISSRYLSEEERINIADLRRSGLSIRKIADQLGRAPSTVSRELRRNSRRDGQYRPFEAHRWAVQRRVRRHRRRIDKNPDLCELIAELLAQRWSPQQIARHLRRKYPDDRSMWLCHESIYQAVYQPQSRLIRPPQVKSPHRGPLRTGRTHRRAHLRPGRRRPRFAQPMLSIHQRPFDPADRSEPGHWEGDLIVGKNQGSAIGTLVERQTRLIRLLHLPTHDAYWPAHRDHRDHERLAGDAGPVHHVGSGHRNGPAHRHHRRPGRAGLLLRLPLTVAASQQRELQRSATAILPKGHQPQHLHARPSAGCRIRDQ